MKEFDRLYKVVKRLRKECPWDKAQNHATLKPYMVEEVYEALEAIDHKDHQKLREELGDQLLHILMHAVMGAEEKKFDIKEIIDDVTQKMIRRHPHVFGSGTAKTKDQVLEKWEEIKKAERGRKHKNILESVPQSLPALYRADKVQKRAALVGFDWDVVAGAWEKVHEEIGEIGSLLDSKSKSKNGRLKEELGDLLFAVVNVSRKTGIDAEEALQASTSKFMRRFRQVEDRAQKKGKKLKKMKLREMDRIWDEVKKDESKR